MAVQLGAHPNSLSLEQREITCNDEGISAEQYALSRKPEEHKSFIVKDLVGCGKVVVTFFLTTGNFALALSSLEWEDSGYLWNALSVDCVGFAISKDGFEYFTLATELEYL